jgi:hypothetical protein
MQRLAKSSKLEQAYDFALSRLKQGFDSPWGRQFLLTSAASLQKLSAASSLRSRRGRLPGNNLIERSEFTKTERRTYKNRVLLGLASLNS